MEQYRGNFLYFLGRPTFKLLRITWYQRLAHPYSDVHIAPLAQKPVRSRRFQKMWHIPKKYKRDNYHQQEKLSFVKTISEWGWYRVWISVCQQTFRVKSLQLSNVRLHRAIKLFYNPGVISTLYRAVTFCSCLSFYWMCFHFHWWGPLGYPVEANCDTSSRKMCCSITLLWGSHIKKRWVVKRASVMSGYFSSLLWIHLADLKSQADVFELNWEKS